MFNLRKYAQSFSELVMAKHIKPDPNIKFIHFCNIAKYYLHYNKNYHYLQIKLLDCQSYQLTKMLIDYWAYIYSN